MADRAAIEEAVRAHYADAARRATEGCSDTAESGIGAGCYDPADVEGLPAAAVASSIGCANPVVVAELAEGEVVLDLGSGGGTDVLLSARRVGASGRAYGLDITDEMLELARSHQAEAGITNAEFLQGHMEAIPLPDASVDVVLSNCVIALAVDKGRVFSEAFRVHRPCGRLAIADVVAEEDQASTSADAASWVACVSGALTESRYRAALAMAGFTMTAIQANHAVMDGFTSVIVRASKPVVARSRSLT
jgi:SAM-dependent methyltransferase